eukprot:1812992-Rhodomonas_salina.3
MAKPCADVETMTTERRVGGCGLTMQRGAPGPIRRGERTRELHRQPCDLAVRGDQGLHSAGEPRPARVREPRHGESKLSGRPPCRVAGGIVR